MRSRFQKGSGCFVCEDCGKKTRNVDGNYPYCSKCQERLEHENLHADNDFQDDDCGDKDCPIRHYTEKERWWKR